MTITNNWIINLYESLISTLTQATEYSIQYCIQVDLCDSTSAYSDEFL